MNLEKILHRSPANLLRSSAPCSKSSKYRKIAARVCLLLLGAVAIVCYYLIAPIQLEYASLATLLSYVHQHPNDAEALYFLGKRQEEVNQSSAALQSYWQAISVKANYKEAWTAWLPLAIKQMGPQQTYDALNSFLQQHPQSAYAHLTMALILYQNGYFPSAYHEAQQAATLDPHLLKAWQLVGACSLTQRNYTDAVIAFQHAIQLQPKDWRSHTSLGVALGELNRHSEALPELEKGVLLAPQEGITHAELGKELLRIAHSSEDYESARAQLLEALKLHSTLGLPAMFEIYHLLGASYAAEKNWIRARYWLEAAETLNPNDEATQFELSSVYHHLGLDQLYIQALHKHRAIVAYRLKEKELINQIAVHPDNLNARLALARLHAHHGYLMSALRDYRLLLIRAPQLMVARQELEKLIATINSSNVSPSPIFETSP